MNFEDRVLKHEFQLNDTDDAIIEYIRSNRDKLNKVSIHKMSENLFIAPNAIMRLCRKLEYNGFSELKILILREDKREYDSREDVYKYLMKSVGMIDYDIMKDIVSKIYQSKFCHVIGVGDSLYFCKYFVNNLKAFNKEHCDYYESYREIEYRLNNCDKEDIVFVVSVSGSNSKINSYLKTIKDRGVIIVAITLSNKNELSKIATFSLLFSAEQEIINGYDITDRTGIIILIRELCKIYKSEYYLK